MTKLHPEGKGIFIWRTDDVFNADPHRVTIQARKLGMRWIAIKVADGRYKFNTSRGLNKEYVRTLQRAGIVVFGWQYIYLNHPLQEAKRAEERIKSLELSGFIIDAECDTNGRYRQATTYAEYLKHNLPQGIGIGLTSYRYPTLHPHLPWRELLKVCSFHNPQVYWEGAHNPAEQLDRSYRELTQLKDIPVIPIAPTYHRKGWEPTQKDYAEFMQKVNDLGCQGVSYWRWGAALKYGYTKLIRNMEIDKPKIAGFEERLIVLEAQARKHGWKI